MVVKRILSWYNGNNISNFYIYLNNKIKYKQSGVYDMARRNIAIFSTLMIFHSLFVTSLLTASQAPFIVVVPGQDGSIGYHTTNFLIEELQGSQIGEKYLASVATPQFPYIDLGQKRCQDSLSQCEKPSGTASILFGTSQGTATSINHIASLEN